jgi:recombination protein RecT
MSEKREALKNQVANRAQGGQVQQQKPQGVKDLKTLMAQSNVKDRFNEILGKRAPQFMASIINLTNSSPELQNADGMSVIQSAMVAAALDLPVDKNLGYMWIIGRKDNNRGGQTFAAPQLGYKGFIQLALRTAQYRFINVIDVYEGELVSWNRLTEELKLDFDNRKSDAIEGYAATFELLNGFKKTVYWTKDQVLKHKAKFSKTAMVWNSDFDAMARKTVLKSLLSRWGILSIEMQRAFVEDDEERQEVGETGFDNFPVGEVMDVTATTSVSGEGEIIDIPEDLG